MSLKAPIIAAIDVGTNSFHLVVTTVNHRGMLNIHQREKEVVRLGSGSTDMKYIQPDAMERGITTMEHFTAVARAENADIRAVATSAVREALNKDTFLEKVKHLTGVEIEVISGEEEARLIYIGVLHALPILTQKSLIIDIGGGSTELSIGLNGELLFVNSEKLGAIRLTQRFELDKELTTGKIDACRDYIKGVWAPILKNVLETGFETAVGTSGTILNIAVMSLADNNEIIPDILNGLSISAERIFNITEKIIQAKTVEERRELPGIDPERADIIVGGALILEHAVRELNIDKIVISSYALREGLVFDTLQKQEAIKEYHHLSHLRYESVNNICQIYAVNMIHANHVKTTALQLFDDLQFLHKLGFAERELLEASALLHDVGYHISQDQHHKHSYYLISHCIMPGFTNDEAEIIANIARYHRKSHPNKKHENFTKLPKEKQELVRILSGILRLAEGIDRRQLGVVKNIKALFNTKEINIHLTPVSPDVSLDIELWGANRRKLLLEETLKKHVNFFIKKY